MRTKFWRDNQNEKLSRNVVEYHSQNKLQAMAKEVEKINLKVYTLNNYSIPVVWYKGVAQYANQEQEEALASFLQAYTESPYQIHVLNNVAGAYLANNNFEEAINYYNKALEINPIHREILLNKSIAHFQKENIEQAFVVFMEIDYNPNWSDLYNQAFRVIFNAYLKDKIDNSVDTDIRSWENIIKSDSLKESIIYEYHHNDRDWRDLLDIYNFLELKN